jgi:hypothetical protein
LPPGEEPTRQGSRKAPRGDIGAPSAGNAGFVVIQTHLSFGFERKTIERFTSMRPPVAAAAPIPATRCKNPRGRRAAGRLSSAARRGRCRGRRNGRRRAREATLLKIYVYGYLNRVQSWPRTDFAQDRTKQGKITQARRVPYSAIMRRMSSPSRPARAASIIGRKIASIVSRIRWPLSRRTASSRAISLRPRH